MEGVDVSQQFYSTSPSVPSPTASHIACLSNARLIIRSLTTFEIIRGTPLPSSHNLRHTRIAWSPPVLASVSRPSSASTPPRRSSRPPQPRSNRVLVTDDDTTRVYDLRDERWNAVISNGSGGMGKIAHVEFGASEDEVLIWSDFCAGVKAWCLRSGRSVEIRDPKFIGRDGRGWGVRPSNDIRAGRGGRGEVMALLCRSAGVDVLMILAPRTYAVLNRVELPTVDAAGLKWSRDGRWLAIWDAASSGYKLHIYTADGHLYRTITREPAAEADIDTNEHAIEGLGIKSVEWLPGNTCLAIGGWDKRVRILSTRTFAPVVFLDHTAVIHVPSAPVYTECVDGQGNRSYSLTPQPTTPPKAPLEKNETPLMKQGISLLAFNADGTLCATRADASPSTVWIWNLRSLKPSMICIQYAPVKSLQWHPTDNSRLLIQTTHDSPTVYLYTATTAPPSTSTSKSQSPTPSSTTNTTHPTSSSPTLPHPPSILSLSTHLTKPPSSIPPKHTLHWLPTPSNKNPVFTLSHNHAYILVWPAGKDQILRFEHQDDGEQDGGDSDDSLFEILTGKKSGVQQGGGVGGVGHGIGMERFSRDGVEGVGDEDEDEEGGGLDDTFREKRGRGWGEEAGLVDSEGGGYSVADGHGGLGESGLDEMF
ncbi:hypothetical protein T440DRAFT_502292 [Plenodomus tracheiphilus IPT5]|uniref:WD40 repeat-like protein n=1 Tax=Plenodomus tracheiphilus IPT5 TaxID=1408161 RepID=A0A6A7ATX0_9PLEO|nr:hypothetical protein T440DRAFT_502292 [Plenodomus tracheiphilus IPT5]